MRVAIDIAPITFAIKSYASLVLPIKSSPCMSSIAIPNRIDKQRAINKLRFRSSDLKVKNHIRQKMAYNKKCAILSSKPEFNFGSLLPRLTRLNTVTAIV